MNSGKSRRWELWTLVLSFSPLICCVTSVTSHASSESPFLPLQEVAVGPRDPSATHGLLGHGGAVHQAAYESWNC